MAHLGAGRQSGNRPYGLYSAIGHRTSGPYRAATLQAILVVSLPLACQLVPASSLLCPKSPSDQNYSRFPFCSTSLRRTAPRLAYQSLPEASRTKSERLQPVAFLLIVPTCYSIVEMFLLVETSRI